jgi:hypothetical protein
VIPLDEEDQAKLDTWFSVMNLLEHYRALSFEPMYQRGLRLFASDVDRVNRAVKLDIIRKNHLKLVDRWEKRLGRNWRDKLEQD